MPTWLLPVVKYILPHIGSILLAANPSFTKRKEGEAGGAVVQQQIAELQAVASENAGHIKELAEQLRLTVKALEEGAAAAEKRMNRIYALALAAALFSLAALGVVLYFFTR
jgi:hypothetical protein